ncbi:hypothetical protein RclHR1_00330028 [Rhizophagus clarus]|uniref:Patatin n=1 Tax=Rhizophagus clarus TaxID=94130 RepID=A0A2Z6RQ62_9GLOM|nr:hypothetical protein RclHR1_00330028 [Rhizophagus clarus]GES81728.1 patatin [Rhizophagus clarus]
MDGYLKRLETGRERTWILSIDGGGIRGLIPSIILDKLEKVINEKIDDGRKPLGRDLRIADIFDVVAGTSTGSIIALGLTVSDEVDKSKPKHPASKLVDIYEKERNHIFKPSLPFSISSSFPLKFFCTKYKPDNFEALLKENFSRKNNEICTLNDIVEGVHVLVPSYNITKKEEVYFNNYPTYRSTDESDIYTSFSIPDVIRASTAAPTCFPAKEISKNNYIDGGVFMNNPSYFAYRDAQRIYKTNKYVVVSLGTGYYQEEINHLTSGGPAYWGLPFLSLTMNSSSKLVEGYFSNNNNDKNPNKLVYDFEYLPIRPELDRDTSLDDTSQDSINNLRNVAEKYIKEEEFNNLVDKILNYWEPKNLPS